MEHPAASDPPTRCNREGGSVEPTQIPLAWSELGDACITPECSRAQYRRRMCTPCYRRWRRVTPPAERARPTVDQRFAAKVERGAADECWPWTGFRKAEEHGQFYVSRERGLVSAHTFAVELATGAPCPPGLEGCHRCDNPPCCNPAHVYYGTRQQNVDDCGHRGRRPRGERRHNARLGEAEVVQIRFRHAGGASAGALAKEFGVHVQTVWAAVYGKSWVHVGGPIRTARRPVRRAGTGRNVA